MSNNFIIDRLLNEHEAIRAQIKLVSGLIHGWRINKTEKTSGTDLKAMPDIAHHKMNLQHAISYLDEGLKRQYSYENEVLPYLIGDPLMDALLTERQTMMKRLEEINFLLLHITPEGLAAIWDDLRKVLTNFSHWLIDHNMLEDAMLKNIKTITQERPRVLVHSV